MEYKLSDIAKIFNCPPSTIRYYDKHNLIPFMRRNENGERYIDGADVTSIQLIHLLKESGCSLKKISEIISLCEFEKQNNTDPSESFLQVESVIDQHIDDLLSKQEELIKQIKISRYIRWYFDCCTKAGSSLVFADKDAPVYTGSLPDGLQTAEELNLQMQELYNDYLKKYQS